MILKFLLKSIEEKTDSNDAVDEYGKEFKKVVMSYFKRISKKIAKKYGKVTKVDLLLLLSKNNIDDESLLDETFVEEITYQINMIFEVSGHKALKQLGTKAEVSTKEVSKLALQYATDHAAGLITMIDETTRNLLRTEIANGVELGLTTDEIKYNIMNSSSFSEARADRIARTEIVNAHIQGNMQTWDKSGLVDKVEWYTGRDERTCSICNSNHKHVVKVGNAFPSGSFHPPAHPHCRCDLLPVLNS